MNEEGIAAIEREIYVKHHATMYYVGPDPPANQHLFAVVVVFPDGLVELDRFKSWDGVVGPIHGGYHLQDPEHRKVWDAGRDVMQWLCDHEFVQLRPIGPEDSEYFATSKLTGE